MRIANRLTDARCGSVMAKVPSSTRGSGLAKTKRSSVNASGSSSTARAERLTSPRPLPSDDVSVTGAFGTSAASLRCVARPSSCAPAEAATGAAAGATADGG